MSAYIHIAVDAMSGDLGPRVVIDACQKILSQIPDIKLTLVGDASVQAMMTKLPPQRVNFLLAEQVVAMDDLPSAALRHKKDSSMRKSLVCLASGEVDACVSAGNTGALILLSQHLIGCYEQVERAAICRVIPTRKNITALLDLGAVPSASAFQLLQFGLMGREFVSAHGVKTAKIALLNIGSESHKGTEQVQQAQDLFQEKLPQAYVGFVEAHRIFDGEINVIVTDGFTGNVALKASEGVARFILDKIKEAYERNFFSRFLRVLSSPVLTYLKQGLDPSAYNGAVFLGLKKVVVKSHGDSDAVGFAAAIRLAYEQAKNQVPEKISHALSHSLHSKF